VNYRHAFHVGNHADVLKHAVLLFCLEALKRKPTPFAVLDTHAGVGLYDLWSDEALRSPEWRRGVARVWEWSEPPALIARYLEAVRAFNADGGLRMYPGSPALIVRALRDGDTLAACELHPDDYHSLRNALPRVGNVNVHHRDGWEALGALLPPSQKRGLVLIDPPYEAPDELERAAREFGPALKRFGHGTYLWWRPMKNESALNAADAEARAQGAKATLRADLWVDAPKLEDKLVGSSLLLLNPPYGLEAELREALPQLSQLLGTGTAGWRVTAREQ
jgi:23S rRNA (adenine2030-N6)-methyltransferase